MLAVLCLLLTAACGFDYRIKKIPNALVVSAVFAGFLFRFQRDGAGGLLLYLLGAMLITAILYPLYIIGGIGAGDVKLLGAAAGYFPFERIFLFSFVSLLIAAIISLVKLLVNKNFRERLGVFFGYMKKSAGTGALCPYPAAAEREKAGVCLSGPILLSLLLYFGGVY